MRDSLTAIEQINQFIADADQQRFVADDRTVAAVERKLLMLSEAAARLGDDAERLCPGQPWREIRGIGNWLRHQYDRVDPDTVWNTVRDDLPTLKVAVVEALCRLKENLESFD